MSNFRIDHLDGPRYDFINGSYYGAPLGPVRLGEEPQVYFRRPGGARVFRRKRASKCGEKQKTLASK